MSKNNKEILNDCFDMLDKIEDNVWSISRNIDISLQKKEKDCILDYLAASNCLSDYLASSNGLRLSLIHLKSCFKML